MREVVSGDKGMEEQEGAREQGGKWVREAGCREKQGKKSRVGKRGRNCLDNFSKGRCLPDFKSIVSPPVSVLLFVWKIGIRDRLATTHLLYLHFSATVFLSP